MDNGVGALLISPDLLPDDRSKQALVATVLRVRAIQSPGLLPIADLVADGPNTWLVAGAPAEPCVADLLTAPLSLSCARAVLHDTAASLADVHAAGAVHGGVSAQSVVVDAEGRSVLAETGLLPVLLGRTVSAEQDVQAWLALANLVVAQWVHDDGAGSRELLRVADRAVSEGLDAVVCATAADLDAGRRALAEAAHPTPQPVAADPSSTMIGRRRAAVAPVPPTSGSVPHESGGQPGQAVRFGPGVAAAAPPAALAAIDYLRSHDDAVRRRQRRTARRRWLATIVIIAFVLGYLLWRSSWAVSVKRVTVAANPQSTAACDARIDFTGTVHVSGAGQLRYQWIRSDGTQSAVEHRNVLPGQHAVTAHLFWSFSGPGRYQAVAHLKVWGAHTVTGQATATYDCRS